MPRRPATDEPADPGDARAAESGRDARAAGSGGDDPDALAASLEEGIEAELADADHPLRGGRWWTWLLRVGVSVALLWILIKKVADVSLVDLLPEWTATTIAWLVVALGLTLVGVVLAALRWDQVLVAMGLPRPSLSRLTRHYFAGQAVSNVLPTTIGGDVLRAARLAGDTGDAADSFASLIIERLTGWLVLPLLTFVGFALDASVRGMGRRAALALAISVGTLVALVAILFVADHPRLGGRFTHRDGWIRFLGSVHLGVSRLRRHPGSAGRVIAAGCVYQLVLVVAATAAARALAIDISFTALLALYPAVLITQVLPIGIAGLGLREGALVYFLAPLGVPHDQAVALGLLLFFLNLLVSVLGVPALLAGRGSGRVTS
jgi:uncharacterized membrane protein YbhN (UPF0104 family)